jgi:hypothetical protein
VFDEIVPVERPDAVEAARSAETADSLFDSETVIFEQPERINDAARANTPIPFKILFFIQSPFFRCMTTFYNLQSSDKTENNRIKVRTTKAQHHPALKKTKRLPVFIRGSLT